MVLKQLDILHKQKNKQKKESRPIPYTLHKN